MKALALLLLACIASSAQADARKTAPSAYTKAARDAFAKAVQAEDSGDLNEARSQYERAFEISPHPATAYNLAGVLDRQGLYFLAVETYELYLLLAPAAPDRAQVEAMIASRIQQKVPLVLEDGGSLMFETAFILVDGVVVAKPGQARPNDKLSRSATTLAVTAGVHTIDVVTPISFSSVRYDVQLRDSNRVTMGAPTSVEGNVVISVAALAGNDGKTQSVRIQPPPGTYVMNVEEARHQCVPLSVDIPKTIKGILFVYAALTEQRVDPDGPARCRTYVVKQQTLVFPP